MKILLAILLGSIVSLSFTSLQAETSPDEEGEKEEEVAVMEWASGRTALLKDHQGRAA